MEAKAGWLDRTLSPGLLRWEAVAVCLVTWLSLLAIPVSLGGLGLGWDALNHHIYLGWTAEQHRFDLDFLGAGFQSFQSPYLYWPVYKMAASGWTGLSAGAVLASLHIVVVWPVWMLARACVPGSSFFHLAMRVLAVALALASSVVLSAFGSSMNDVLAAAPLVWAVALVVGPIARGEVAGTTARRNVALSGVCAGLAVGLKLSNGPLAACMPALWWLYARDLRSRVQTTSLGVLGASAGFFLGYGHWGWLLWKEFGNPVYPFHGQWFALLRLWLGYPG